MHRPLNLRRHLAHSRLGVFAVLSWLLSVVGSVVGIGSHARVEDAGLRPEMADERAADADARDHAAWVDDFRSLAVAAASFLDQHPSDHARIEQQLAPLKEKANEVFAPYAITLRKIELAIVDPEVLARAPGFLTGAYRDFKLACMLGDAPFAALREIPWLERHRTNLERLLRHLPPLDEAALVAAEPVTDFVSPVFSARLAALRRRA